MNLKSWVTSVDGAAAPILTVNGGSSHDYH